MSDDATTPPKGRTYTCANCGETHTSEWTEEEARAEAATIFGDEQDMDVVCDDCYKEIMEWRAPQVN